MSIGVAMVDEKGKILHWCYGVHDEEGKPIEGVDDFGEGSGNAFRSICINWPSRKERKALGNDYEQRCVYLFQPYEAWYCVEEISDYTLENYQHNVVLHGGTGEVLAKGFCMCFENDGNLFGLLFPEIISSREHKVFEKCDWTCIEHRVRYVLHLWEGENFLAGKPADIVYPLKLDDLFQKHVTVYLNDSAWGGYEMDIEARLHPHHFDDRPERYHLRFFHFKKFRGKIRAKIIDPVKDPSYNGSSLKDGRKKN
jgi:hypothetical protein